MTKSFFELLKIKFEKALTSTGKYNILFKAVKIQAASTCDEVRGCS